MHDVPSISGKSTSDLELHADTRVMVEQAVFQGPGRLTGPVCPSVDSTTDTLSDTRAGGGALLSPLLSSNRLLMIKRTALVLEMIERDGCRSAGCVEETD